MMEKNILILYNGCGVYGNDLTLDLYLCPTNHKFANEEREKGLYLKDEGFFVIF